MKTTLIALLMTALLALASQASAAYISTSLGGLYHYDIGQGTTTFIGKTGPGMTDIAINANKLYGITFSSFYSIDHQTGQSTFIRSLGNLGINALEGGLTGNTLYTASYNGTFGTLNSDTGEYTLIGSLGKYKGQWLKSSGDLAFGADGTLYATVNNGRTEYLATIDLNTGKANVLGAIGFGQVYGLVYFNDTLYGTTANKQLLEINPATGQGSLVAKLGEIGNGAIWGATGGTTSSTPEPSTLLLLAPAMGFIWWRRRKIQA